MARLLQATNPPRVNPAITLSLLIFICLLVCLFRRRIQSATRLYTTLAKTKLPHFGYSQSWVRLRKQPSYAFGLLHPFDPKAQGGQTHGELLFSGQRQDL